MRGWRVLAVGEPIGLVRSALDCKQLAGGVCGLGSVIEEIAVVAFGILLGSYRLEIDPVVDHT